MSSFSQLDDLAENVTSKVSGRQKRADAPYVGLEHLQTDNPTIGSHALAAESISVNTVFRAGYTLFGKLRPNLRKVAVAPFDGYCSTDILVLRARAGVDPAYLGYLMQSRQLLDYAAGTAFGTKMPRTSWESIRALTVFAPGPAEQKRIACVLDAIDDKIRCIRQTIAKLDKLHRGLREDLIGSRMNTEKVLGEALNGGPANGIYKPAELIGRGTLLVGQTAFTHDRRVDPRLARRAVTNAVERNRFGLVPDDLLVSRVFATLDGVGQPALVGELHEDAVFESNMMRLRVSGSKADPYFVFQCLLTGSARRHVTQMANLSNQASIGQVVLLGLPTWLPSVDEQRRVSGALRAAEARIRAEEKTLGKLEDSRSGMMTDLLTGRIRVPLEAAA